MKKFYFLALTLIISLLAACSESSVQREESPQPKAQTDYHFAGVKLVDDPQTRGVALKNKLWHPTASIRIKFLNGTAAQQAEVKQVAQEWLDLTPDLNFDWITTGDADVRISIDGTRRISWSTIGTDCKAVTNQNEATMNLAFSSLLDEAARKGATLRAFGQMLGLELEHRHINLVASWDPMMEALAQIMYADIPLATFREYVLDPLTDVNNLESTDYDPSSIMVWGIPLGFVVLNDGYTAPQVDNKVLSATDKQFISQLYGPSETYLMLSTLEQAVPYNGGSFRITITSNTSWNLVAPSWITLSQTSGSGNAEITVTVAANTTNGARSGSILAVPAQGTGQTCVVIQDVLKLSISPTSLTPPYNGGTYNITVTANTNWTLTAPSWITLSQTTGTGDATVRVTVAANSTVNTRTEYITLSGGGKTARITVTQAGMPVTYTITNQYPRLYWGPDPDMEWDPEFPFPVWSVTISVKKSVAGGTPTPVSCEIREVQNLGALSDCVTFGTNTVAVYDPGVFMKKPNSAYTILFYLHYDNQRTYCYATFEKYYGDITRGSALAEFVDVSFLNSAPIQIAGLDGTAYDVSYQANAR